MAGDSRRIASKAVDEGPLPAAPCMRLLGFASDASLPPSPFYVQRALPGARIIPSHGPRKLHRFQEMTMALQEWMRPRAASSSLQDSSSSQATYMCNFNCNCNCNSACSLKRVLRSTACKCNITPQTQPQQQLHVSDDQLGGGCRYLPLCSSMQWSCRRLSKAMRQYSNTPSGTKDEGLFAAFRDPAVPANFKLQPLQILRLLLGGFSQ